jgi:uncharacterized protein YhaN
MRVCATAGGSQAGQLNPASEAWLERLFSTKLQEKLQGVEQELQANKQELQAYKQELEGLKAARTKQLKEQEERLTQKLQDMEAKLKQGDGLPAISVLCQSARGVVRAVAHCVMFPTAFAHSCDAQMTGIRRLRETRP